MVMFIWFSLNTKIFDILLVQLSKQSVEGPIELTTHGTRIARLFREAGGLDRLLYDHKVSLFLCPPVLTYVYH